MEFVEKIYRKAGLFKLSKKELSKRIWNCDETAFATAPSSRMVLAKLGEELSLYMRPCQGVDVNTLLSIGVEMPMETKSLPMFYIKLSTFIIPGPLVALLKQCMEYQPAGGWKDKTFTAGL